MKREIKFRAWDSEMRVMHPPFTLSEIGEIRRDGGGIGAIAMNYSWDELLWLQFTGLRDKNGKEIYEGDLWKDIDETGQFEDAVYEVCYDDFNAEFSSRRKSLKYPTRDDGYTYYGFCLRNITVIGNIYENPELLNQKL